MKFAKELEDDLVPEWRAKYINYKLGKKKIKAVSKALRNTNRTPKVKPPFTTASSSGSIPYTQYDFNKRKQKDGAADDSPAENGNAVQRPIQALRRMSTTMFSTSPPLQAVESQPGSSSDEADSADELDEERTPLKKDIATGLEDDTPTSYGSITKDDQQNNTSSPATSPQVGRMPRLALPDPALDPSRERSSSLKSGTLQKKPDRIEQHPKDNESGPLDLKKDHKHSLVKAMFQRKKDRAEREAVSSPGQTSKHDQLKNVFRPKEINSPNFTNAQQQAYNDLDVRQDEFFDFLDKELNKIETFYKSKEDEAKHRLEALRAQLHEHRDQRARDIEYHQNLKNGTRRPDGRISEWLAETPLPSAPMKDAGKKITNGTLFNKVFRTDPKIGKTSKAMENLASPATSPRSQANDPHRDYVKRRPTQGNENVPHKFAKRRLKLALQEFYRGLELLKSYAILNRTGFRKINKKYDKAVNARPPLRYLNEKVSKAYFVKSTAIDEYLVAIEDMYARYFERGNRKIAVNKLRSRLQAGDHSGSAFRNGLWLAGGTGFAIAGLYNGLDVLLNTTNPTLKVQTSYLFQLYAGYFLALLLFLMFVLDCKIWTSARINYIFVFEYDTRSVLDWRQLAELPCFFLFLNGLFLWLNFQMTDVHPMFLYWPILLFGITLLIMALPVKILYYHARVWWAFSNFRLLFAGIYPVEFRDFFLGDMYCSETYTMSQIELFFCLYRWNWVDPPRCNSNHSMLLGFFTTLPGIWRFLQCIRRYHDSGKWFPHLANCAKYSCNILYYMSLSLYRLHINDSSSVHYRIAFIFFACLNALYCSFWDICMDWSLGNFFSKNVGLRDQLAYRRKWVYYVAIVVNIILRHQWIFYAIFTEDLQHSAATSFFVGLAEVLRRGMWTLFRVENEHTNNVKSYRASRDIPLPYSLPESPTTTALDDQQLSVPKRRQTPSDRKPDQQQQRPNGRTTGTDLDLEQQQSSTSSLSRRISISQTPAIRALQRVGTAIGTAHSQDFQRRKRPEVVGDSPADETMLKNEDGYNSSDDDEDDHHQIEGSVLGDNDNDNDDGAVSPRQISRRRGGGGIDAEEGGDEDIDAGEGSSGDSREERELNEVRRVADAYHPESGFRGSAGRQDGPVGGSSSRKKNA